MANMDYLSNNLNYCLCCGEIERMKLCIYCKKRVLKAKAKTELCTMCQNLRLCVAIKEGRIIIK